MNLSGRSGDIFVGARLRRGSIISSGIALAFEPTRLYHTTMCCV